MSDQEESREEIEQIVNNNEEEVKEEIVKEEIVKEEVKEEVVKPKAKAKTRAKPKVKIVKEPVEVLEIIEEQEEQVTVEKPKKVDKLKEIVKCPDCNMDMTQHTLKYIHKRRGFCKADIKTETEKTKVTVPEQVTIPENKPKIT